MDNMNPPGPQQPGQAPPPQGQPAQPQQQWPQYPWPQQDGGAYYMMVQYPPPAAQPPPPAPAPPPPKTKRSLRTLTIVLGCVLAASLVLNAAQFNSNRHWRQSAASAQEAALAAQSSLADAETQVSALEGQLDILTGQAAVLEESLEAQVKKNEALEQNKTELEEMLAEAQASGSTFTPDMVYVNIMDYTKMASNFAGVLYHEYGCPKLDSDQYLGAPVKLVASTRMEPCPECH